MIEVDLLGERRGRRSSTEKAAPWRFTRILPRDGWMIGSTVVLFAALVTVVNLFTASRQDAAGMAGRMEAAVRDSLRIAAAAEAVHVLEARRDSIAERLRLVLEMDAQRYVWPHLMDEIAGALPRDAWLTRLARATSPEGGVRLHIEGRAQGGVALTRFWNRMEASPFIRGVRLINSERIERPLSDDSEELYGFAFEAEHAIPDPELIELVSLADTAAW